MRKGTVSVAEFRPDLVSQWSDRNTLRPEMTARGSGVKVWWLGPCGHEWFAPVDNRCYNNTGCPYCTARGGKKLKPGLNDLATVNPDLAAQWHPTLNGSVTPADTLPAVKVKYWWLCPDCGREWKALVNMRHSRGTGCPSCRGRLRGLTNTESLEGHPICREWSDRNTLAPADFTVSSRHRAWWKCKKGHEWQSAIGDRVVKATKCKQCGSGGTSEGEIELRDFIKGLGFPVRAHHRQIDPKYEYDITIETLKIAIEYNGLYWHSEAVKPQNYHRDKYLAASRAGWRVIYVWEDDWKTRRSVVEKYLRHQLGSSQERRYNARSLRVSAVSAREAKDFLNENHLQGSTPGSVRIGLQDKSGATLAVMVFRSRGGGTWELSRYATSAVVRGGFSKLLQSFIRENGPVSITTFSDTSVSEGSLYQSQGFVRDGELSPDYTYLVRGERVHKFNYRKSRFKSDPGLEYREGLTERELASLNRLLRIYDAGKVRWTLNC